MHISALILYQRCCGSVRKTGFLEKQMFALIASWLLEELWMISSSSSCVGKFLCECRGVNCFCIFSPLLPVLSKKRDLGSWFSSSAGELGLLYTRDLRKNRNIVIRSTNQGEGGLER